MTPVEILAAIFGAIVILKVIASVAKPQARIKFLKKALGRPKTMSVIYLILAIVVGFYLLQTLSIVHVAAAMLFTFLLMGIGFAAYSKEMIGFAERVFKDRTKAWLSMLIWLIIALWTLIVVFV